jgi:hypothetical protein
MAFEAVLPIGSTPAEFAEHIKTGHARIGNLIRTFGSSSSPSIARGALNAARLNPVKLLSFRGVPLHIPSER